MPISEPFKLSLWQKRQATLLYHFASLEYLKGLKPLIDALIDGTDLLLDVARQQGRDALLVSTRWGARDTSANWGTYGFPALIDFRESVIRQIAKRAMEEYSGTGVNSCAHMLSELSMGWATQEEEDGFKERFEQVYEYASAIDRVLKRPPTAKDYTYWAIWKREKSQFPRLPRFCVRADVEGETDKIPPRTGVYVPQDDPYGALQFRWTGGGYGELCETYTFNEIGLDAVATLGRDGLWDDNQALLRFLQQPKYRGVFTDLGGDEVTDADIAGSVVARESFVARPCKWYFVEMINGEYETQEESQGLPATGSPQRVPAGQPCPKSGWWSTPAKAHSRRYFAAGDTFPEIDGSDYGATFWLLAGDQPV